MAPAPMMQNFAEWGFCLCARPLISSTAAGMPGSNLVIAVLISVYGSAKSPDRFMRRIPPSTFDPAPVT